MSFDDYAIYLPAVNAGYAADVCKRQPRGRPFPDGIDLPDLAFWEPNPLWHYPYLLHSLGLYRVGKLPDNAVTRRNSANNMLLGDSGGFQIGSGTLKGLKALKSKPMPAIAAELAWKGEYDARKWIVGWLETYANYGMTIDMPLWATSMDGKKSPFHNCTAAQLIAMTVSNLKFIRDYAKPEAKWLNVVQGGVDTTQIRVWWNAVKWFRRGGWAMAGSAGKKGGIASMLSTLLMMRDENAFDTGQNWVHVLGVSTAKWAVLLSAIQQALRKINPVLQVSFDSSSPIQTGGRYERIALTPAFTHRENTWSIGDELAPQSRLDANPKLTIPFKHNQSPLGQRLLLNHLSIRDGMFDKRNFDSISNTLLIHHNIWVYVDAFETANDLVLARDKARVPALYLDCIDFIANVFQCGSWQASIAANKGLLDSVAPNEY